ncbi:MAG: T9SS type A sorting domain-containing protein [Saprospiraceae bacterium]|nr:T9SS type A sorting domain-containing protein [Saprospiraceae bacterium]
MQTLQYFLFLFISYQIGAQNFSEKKVIIYDLMPVISSGGSIRLEDMVYCRSLEDGKVNFIAHMNGKLEFYEYDNHQLTKMAGQTPFPGIIVDFVDQNWDGKVDIQGNFELLSNAGNYNFTNIGYPIDGNWNVRANRIVDFDEDGNYDIVSSSVSFSSGAVNINLLGGNRKLLNKITFPEVGLITTVKVIDINNDDLLDVVYTTKKFGDDKLIIQTNEGDGSFDKQEIKVSYTGEQLEFGDINKDAFLDIIITGFSGTDILVFNSLNGTFGNKVVLTNSGEIYNIKLNDFDNDGNLDIVYLENMNFDSVNIVVGKGTGTNTFDNMTSIGKIAFDGYNTQTPQALENWMSIYDYDQDGDSDILVNAILEKKYVAFDNLRISTDTKDNYKETDVHFYPNPGVNIIQIQNENEFDRLEIYNMQGKMVSHYNLMGSSEIDVQNLTRGLYFFKFSNGEKFTVHKFTKY